MTRAQALAAKKESKRAAQALSVLRDHLAKAEAERTKVTRQLQPQGAQEIAARDEKQREFDRCWQARADEAWSLLKNIGAVVHADPQFDPRKAASDFLASIPQNQRRPLPSMRFYPIPYESYLRRWKTWLDDSITFFEAQIARLSARADGVQPAASGTVYQQKQKNEAYYAQTKKLVTELEFFRADQKAENLMFCPKRFTVVCVSGNLVCWVDVCSDLFGSNA